MQVFLILVDTDHNFDMANYLTLCLSGTYIRSIKSHDE